MTFNLSDLKQRAEDLYATYENGSWGSGFIDDPGELLTVYDDFVDGPDPDDFGGYTDALLTSMEKLAPTGFDTNTTDSSGEPVKGYANTVLDQVHNVGIEVEDWTGRGADNFFQWSAGWKTGISNQFAAVTVLRELLHAEAAIWTAVCEDLDKISQAAIEALEAADDQFDTGAGDLEVTLKIFGAIVAVAGAIPTAGASLSITSVLGAGITVVSTGMDVAKAGKAEPRSISACCPRGMLESLKDAVGEVRETLRVHEEMLKNDVRANISEIESNWKLFCPDPPALAGVPRSQIGGYDGLGGWGGQAS